MSKAVKVNDIIDDYYNAYYLVTGVDNDTIYYRECVKDDDNEYILHVYGYEDIISKEEFNASDKWEVIESVDERYTVMYE